MRRLHLLTAAAIALTEALVAGSSPGGRDVRLRSSCGGPAEAVAEGFSRAGARPAALKCGPPSALAPSQSTSDVAGSGGEAGGSGSSRIEQPAADAPDALYRMALGDPARRDREISPVLDRYLDTHTGDLLTPDALAARLSRSRLLLLGESHASMEFHRVQLQVLQALERQGRRVLVGLEMYPYTEQPALDAFGSGSITEAEFIDRSRWYEHWGYPSLGVAAIAGTGARAIIDVARDSPGGRAGLQAGDLMTALDDSPVTSRGIMNRLMAGKQWGDVVAVTVTRDGVRQVIAVPLTRTPPE